LQARFLSGDYDTANAAAEKAKALLWLVEPFIQSVNYYYYSALARAAVYDTAASDRQAEGLAVLKQSLERLREWADIGPKTFSDKYTLVAAEIARLEGQDIEAMRFYEEAIRLAREHGFIQNEGIAHELAARFYGARG